MEFKQYIGLGDSISTDDYPGKGLGAISLFFRNNNQIHPSFSGKDLVSKFKSIELVSLARDGATSRDVLENQMPLLRQTNEPTLVTLTAGGNDILQDMSDTSFNQNLDEILSQLKSKYPNSLVLLGTIYDPSDYVGKFVKTRFSANIKRIYQLNKVIRAKGYNNQVAIADIHKHFLGHGVPLSWIPENYWYQWLIEPNVRGGSEVRKVFLNTLDKYQRSKN